MLDSGWPYLNSCHNTWLDCFMETLSNEEKEFVKTEASVNYFKFGDGKMVPSYKMVKVQTEVFILTEVIEGDVLLLLSKAAMKRVDVKIYFTSDPLMSYRDAEGMGILDLYVLYSPLQSVFIHGRLISFTLIFVFSNTSALFLCFCLTSFGHFIGILYQYGSMRLIM